MPKDIDPSIISDHALLRWFERVGGIDIPWLRAHVAERCRDLIESGASGGWCDGMWVVIRDGKIVTFSPPERKPRKHR